MKAAIMTITATLANLQLLAKVTPALVMMMVEMVTSMMTIP